MDVWGYIAVLLPVLMLAAAAGWNAHPAWQHTTRRWRTHAIEHGRHPGGVVASTERRRR